MKSLIFFGLIFTSLSSWAKPSVLITYFDAFGKSPFNNSAVVAQAVQKLFPSETSEIDLELCQLNTVFDKAYEQTENCLKKMKSRPDFILALGEAGCETEVEMIVHNNDKTFGPDNAGQERNNTPIIAGAPKKLGLSYPLKDLYCGVNKDLRKDITLSTSAGSFVCNNTAYQMSYYYPEMNYAFIHVPANNCKKLEKRTKTATNFIVEILKNHRTWSINTDERLPTTKLEVRDLLQNAQASCEKEFYKRISIKD